MSAAPATHDPCADVQEAVAQRGGFGFCEVTGQGNRRVLASRSMPIATAWHQAVLIA